MDDEIPSFGVAGWELGATYVSRSLPRIEDTVLSAVTDVRWSDRWGRHEPSGWMAERVTVRRRELDHPDPDSTAREVTHCTPFRPDEDVVAHAGDGL